MSSEKDFQPPVPRSGALDSRSAPEVTPGIPHVVDYDYIAGNIKSSNTEGTVATFSYGKGSTTYPEGKMLGRMILIKNKTGEVGVIGLPENLTVSYDKVQKKNVLIDRDTGNEVDEIPVTYLAVVNPDGSVRGELPRELQTALSPATKIKPSKGSAFFYGAALVGGLSKKIEEQKKLKGPANPEV